MPRIGIIIAILIGLFKLMQLVLQASAKRKEQERIRQEAERRRLSSGQMSVPRTIGRSDDGTGTGDVVPRTGAGSTPQPVRADRSGDDLAARRRAQLDELRTKREGRRTTISSAPIRPTPSAPSPRSQRSSAIPPQVAREERTRVRELEQQRLQREEQARRKQLEMQVAQHRKAAEDARLAGERAKRQMSPQTAPTEARRPAVSGITGTTVVSTARSAKSPSTAAIVEMLRSPSSLRHALVLKEVLDKPLALRNS